MELGELESFVAVVQQHLANQNSKIDLPMAIVVVVVAVCSLAAAVVVEPPLLLVAFDGGQHHGAVTACKCQNRIARQKHFIELTYPGGIVS